MSLVFRDGTAADLAAVYKLNRLALPEWWSYEGLEKALKEGYELLVCSNNDVLAGYLLSYNVIDEVHIMQIAVAPDYRRNSIAETLSRRLIAAKPGMTLLLEVRASNLAAQSLYEKLGFVRAGIRKEYYIPKQQGEPREDAVLMTLEPDRR